MLQWIKDVRDKLSDEFGNTPAVCVMATVDLHGHPTARCMVCREVDSNGHLTFLSDRRTRKDDHIRACPDTEICFWLPKTSTQIRVRGSATVIDAEADTFMREIWWEKLPQANREHFVSAREAEDPDVPMPVTFELIVVDASQVEMQEISFHPHRRREWKSGAKEWELVGV